MRREVDSRPFVFDRDGSTYTMSTDTQADENRDELIAFRVEESLSQRVETHVENGVFESRSAAIRFFIRSGLRSIPDVDEEIEEELEA